MGMGPKLVECPNALLLIDVVQYILDAYTVEKSSAITTLNMTGVTMDQLTRLTEYTTGDHFTISGNIEFSQDWQGDILNLITVRHNTLNLFGRFDWGDIRISWTTADVPLDNYVSLNAQERETLSIGCYINPDLDEPRGGYDFNRQIFTLLPILGFDPKRGERQESADGTLINIDLFRNRRWFLLAFRDVQYIEKTRKLLECFIGGIPQPDSYHLILTSDFRTIKHLHDSGKVKPCGKNCCPSHLAYNRLLPMSTDIDTSKIHQLANFLTSETARERMIDFAKFRWIWENEPEAQYVNSLVLYLSRRKPPCIYMWRDEANPLPRGIVRKMQQDAAAFLEKRGG